MCSFKPQSENGSSSPSPAGFLRSNRSADSEASHSRRRRNPTCHAGGGRYRLERSSVSPFERSGKTTAMRHQIYTKVSPEGDDHLPYGRGCGNDDDDDWMCDDDAFEGEDGGELSPEQVRNSSWLRDFLARLGEMKPEEVTGPVVQTLCPACKGGPGRSIWYRGFQALLDHARGIRAKRVWLHRRFAQILEEELRNRSGKSAGEGGAPERATAPEDRWAGLVGTDDRMIPWPPMVVVLNTRLGKQEGSDMMGNLDLLDCFKEYEPVKALSSYKSHGHCGASLLIFDNSVLGYHQAERLQNHFKREGRGKYEWHKEKPWKQHTTENRLLYGYMATKEEELTMFSTQYGDEQKLTYEMKPYQMVVGTPLKEMYESMQKQPLLEREIAKEIEQNKDLGGKLHQRDLEIEATKQLLTEQSVEHDEQIDSMKELCERLSSKLNDKDEANSTTFGKQRNTGDGEQDSTNIEVDETGEEKPYLGTCDSGDEKMGPLLWGYPLKS